MSAQSVERRLAAILFMDLVDTHTIELSETAELDEEGRIVRLTDVYPEGQDEMLGWFERHGAEFDPSYI